MRQARDFTRTLRRGRRAGGQFVVVHIAATPSTREPTKIGFIVNKQVGNSVVRHQVTRRLRAAMSGRLPDWPAGLLIVVRALPSAAAASTPQLAGDVDAALAGLAESATRQPAKEAVA